MFTYTKEKQLHEYIVEHFNNYFDFDYVGSEYVIKGGRIDIIGKNDNTVYVVELKRDFITNNTIEQLKTYLPIIQKQNPNKSVVGIAVAPTIDTNVKIENLPENIITQTINNVNFIPKEPETTKKRVTYTLEEEIIERLKNVSKDTMIPQSKLVEKAINNVLNEHEKEQSD